MSANLDLVCRYIESVILNTFIYSRKNPEHFTEFSHPGDQSFDEHSDLDDEDDRPDCPYGPSCYR